MTAMVLLQIELGIIFAQLIGLFFGAILSNASFLFLIPFDFVVFGFAPLTGIHPIIVGVIAGIGAAIGEMTSYVVGFGGIKAFEKIKHKNVFRIDSFKKKIEKYGVIVIFLGALTPFPFDLIALAAGVIKYNVQKFFVATAIGKICRYSLIAYAGLIGIEWVTKYLIFSPA